MTLLYSRLTKEKYKYLANNICYSSSQNGIPCDDHYRNILTCRHAMHSSIMMLRKSSLVPRRSKRDEANKRGLLLSATRQGFCFFFQFESYVTTIYSIWGHCGMCVHMHGLIQRPPSCSGLGMRLTFPSLRYLAGCSVPMRTLWGLQLPITCQSHDRNTCTQMIITRK